MLEIWGGIASLASMSTPTVARKQEKERTVAYLAYLVFNLPLTKSSQKRKTARHCRTSDEKQYFQYWMLRLVVTN